jgi:hypothetical protein
MSFADCEVTIAQASVFLRVKPKTVSSWISRYAIAAVTRKGQKPRKYRLVSLVEAEFRARENPVGRPRNRPPKALEPTV